MENTEQPLDPRIFEKANLILRYYQGELTTQEREKVEQWLAEDETNQQFAESLKEEDQIQEPLDFLASVDTEAAWQKVAPKIQNPRKKISFWQNSEYLKYAAVLLLVCLAGGFAYKISLTQNAGNPATPMASHQPKAIIPASKVDRNKAQLTLSNGSVIDLDNQKNGTIWHKNGTWITKQDKELHFSFSPEASHNTDRKGLTTLTIPTGSQYKITLPDGSQVWLNAASTLSFSDFSTEKKRVVALTGEAYFEVAKNKHQPFLVKAKGTTVEVLGTHFNVMAYPEENSINTTLLEGSVKVSNTSSHKILQPGFQAKAGTTIEVEKVDVNAAVAWKNGFFHFQNAELKIIMRQLERWYGVEFVNPGRLQNQHFTGIISRKTEVAKILKMLELSGDIHFKTEGKKVIIQPDNI
ncbi:hypothetical protein AHMF7605_20510 [Adhaeribacter arboris]|uniref:Anti-sigma factor n=1 Tax=Adhaeribacter arboris TaxID=2072846 RepID=A0A2T2YJR5_9BACT|nr:FecR domain-containing protein [Adhaeribacter arboris]PSR55715.1 hypothetical protein AHMF7605_20510 [Adhaeribacter arboris]